MFAKQVWYSKKSDIKSPDTIHQTLMFGSLKDILYLKKKLGVNTLNQLFLTYPKKIYTAQAFNFIKKFILEISFSIDEKKYLKSSPRNTR